MRLKVDQHFVVLKIKIAKTTAIHITVGMLNLLANG